MSDSMLWSGPPINQNDSSRLDRLDNVGQALTMIDGVTGVFFFRVESRDESHRDSDRNQPKQTQIPPRSHQAPRVP